MMSKKLNSVTELARYNIGCITYQIILDCEIPPLDDDNIWMANHPRILYEHGPIKHLWKNSNRFSKLPKLNDVDFMEITRLLTSELMIYPFIVEDIRRSCDTGEFYYFNQNDGWMQEICLFDTRIAAVREKNRILKLIKKWASK